MDSTVPSRPTIDGVDIRPSGRASVAIVGGGFSGIAAAYYLKKAGLTRFTVFEASPQLGGTWYENRYPGAEVDTPSHLYCFSFNSFDWSRTHAGADEVRSYLEKTVEQYDLKRFFRFNTIVETAVWSDSHDAYRVTLRDGTSEFFDFVISCVGFLNVPLIPSWVQMSAYPGRIVHTAAWSDDLDLAGKRVGVVGTGSSAVQIIAEAAQTAQAVTVFQRAPNWVLPKRNRPFTDEERKSLRRPWRYRLKFMHEYYKYEKVKILGEQEQPGSKMNLRMKGIAQAHLERALEGRSDLVELLTPDFPFYGKRPIVNDQYYPTLRRPNVVIAPAVREIGERGVVDATGRVHDLDVVVLATGFHAARYLSRLTVKGVEGVDLQAKWNGEPAAYLGSCVPGFPNFFMLYGPNSNAGPVIFMLECQAAFAVANIKSVLRRRAKRVEVRQVAFDRFNTWVQQRLETSSFKSTDNYFTSASGRVVTQWPFSATRFWWMAKIGRRSAMRLSR